MFLKNPKKLSWIMDLHGVIIDNFPIELYYKRVSEFIMKKYNLKDLSEAKEFFLKMVDKHQTGTKAFESINEKDTYNKILDSLPAYDDTDEEFNRLLRSAGELFIVTNSSRKNTLEALNRTGLNINDFKKIITADDVKKGKPDTEPYEMIIKDKPNDFIVVGDRITDIIPAAKLGCPALLCNKKQLKKILRCLHE